MMPDAFDELLMKSLKRGPSPADDAAANRIVERIAGTLPRQNKPFWRLPAVLLDWQFAPAWPRVAALACCALIGFGIGLAGIDRSFRPSDAPMVLAGRDLGSIVFEPEPLTGARP